MRVRKKSVGTFRIESNLINFCGSKMAFQFSDPLLSLHTVSQQPRRKKKASPDGAEAHEPPHSAVDLVDDDDTDNNTLQPSTSNRKRQLVKKSSKELCLYFKSYKGVATRISTLRSSNKRKRGPPHDGCYTLDATAI